MSQRAANVRLCWWCQQAPATTGEHKFKRSDLVREHGGGALLGERELVKLGSGRTRYMKSTRSKPLKFRPSLCEACNSPRSRPLDYAYDQFIEWVLANENQVIDKREIDLGAIFGLNWQEPSLNVLRYWGKHIGCRLFDAGPDEFYERLPAGLIPFLDGGAFPKEFSIELWIEPTWMRFCARRETDPLWTRNLNTEQMYWPEHPDGDGATQAVWRYGWLAMGWAFGKHVPAQNPLQDSPASLPIRAQTSADTEVVFGAVDPDRCKLTEEEAEVRLTAVTGGGPVDPDQELDESPIAEAFTGAVLDFEAGCRGRSPDRRDPPEGEADLALEVQRALLAVELAGTVWGYGHLAVAEVRAVEAPASIDPSHLRALNADLDVYARDRTGMSEVAAQLAQMAALKLIEAEAIGYDFELTDQAENGQDALLDAARCAGCCAAAAGLGANDRVDLWDSLDAARARMARLS